MARRPVRVFYVEGPYAGTERDELLTDVHRDVGGIVRVFTAGYYLIDPAAHSPPGTAAYVATWHDGDPDPSTATTRSEVDPRGSPAARPTARRRS